MCQPDFGQPPAPLVAQFFHDDVVDDLPSKAEPLRCRFIIRV